MKLERARVSHLNAEETMTVGRVRSVRAVFVKRAAVTMQVALAASNVLISHVCLPWSAAPIATATRTSAVKIIAVCPRSLPVKSPIIAPTTWSVITGSVKRVRAAQSTQIALKVRFAIVVEIAA